MTGLLRSLQRFILQNVSKMVKPNQFLHQRKIQSNQLPTQKTKENMLMQHGKAVAEVAVAPENPVVTDVAGKKAAIQHHVEDVAKVAVESSPETPAVTGAAGEEVALQVSVEPVPDLVAATVPELPTQPAAETAVKSVERKVESAASAEPVLKTGAEEVVEFEVAPVVNTVVEQSVEPTPERAADGVVELNIEDAVESVTASDAEAVSDKFSYIPIELSEALDVEPPTTETAPKPLKDPKQSHPEETKPNQHSEHTNTSDIFKKSKEKEQTTQKQNGTRNTNVCSFCDKRIAGNIKLHLSEPVVTCHPDCLKCGVCAKLLGDLLTTMFLHDQVVKCGGCFAKALESES
ncbi:hypothetical protein EPR50_G00136410 [Perca flavescens]|uniref:LIM zinc-binding domain-containing protein n=1 Tax=Perca flavescens TaxID=8167 RepID=A0A484CLI1_PERFV|nr:hypothetical protein EPR50_G00136410 [Perca flavescens]